MQDDQLLIQYARTESDAAFSQIVARHLPLVYRTCRRELGSGTLAEDAAQVVFLLLARKAKTLRAVPSLAGWLFQTARFVAKDVRKQELRRKRREEAVMQESISQQVTPIPDWNSIEPLLNNALAALKPAEREAVLLRFFEGHTLAETGAFLGLSEDAARMRCARALEKLRRYLTAHGAAVTSVVLTGFLTSEAAHPVPAHAAATIAQGTLQAISTGPTANVLLLSKGVSHTMKIIKIKFAAAAAFVVLGGAALPPLVHAFSPHKPGVQTIATPGQLLLSGVPPNIDTHGTVPGNPKAEIAKFHELAAVLTTYSKLHTGAYPPSGTDLLKEILRNMPAYGFHSFPQVLSFFHNPDAKFADDPGVRADPQSFLAFTLPQTRPDGSLRSQSKPSGTQDVDAYTDLYYHQNVKHVGGDRTVSHPVGFYIVLWENGQVEEIQYDKILFVPSGPNDYTSGFPGEAGVPKTAQTYLHLYTKNPS